MTLKYIFNPVAQNTIIRPLAEAVCMVRGGETVSYIDTADHKEKEVTLEKLYFLSLQANVNGRKITLDGQMVAFQAKNKPAKIQVNINDIAVIITPKTSVAAAMAQYKRKWRSQGPLLSLNDRQREQ